jgi:hypothetical protein
MHKTRVCQVIASVLLAISFTGCDDSRKNEEADVAVGPPRGGLTVEIVPPLQAVAPRCFTFLTVRFRNLGPRPVGILKPLDGSEHCLLMPYYRFNVTDPDGGLLERLPRECAFWGPWPANEWPQDQLVEIQPGATLDVETYLPYRFGREGPHTIDFEYVYEPIRERLPPPPTAWRGSIKASEVVIDVTKREQ